MFPDACDWLPLTGGAAGASTPTRARTTSPVEMNHKLLKQLPTDLRLNNPGAPPP
jgi:hypothetical protein